MTDAEWVAAENVRLLDALIAEAYPKLSWEDLILEKPRGARLNPRRDKRTPRNLPKG